MMKMKKFGRSFKIMNEDYSKLLKEMEVHNDIKIKNIVIKKYILGLEKVDGLVKFVDESITRLEELLRDGLMCPDKAIKLIRNYHNLKLIKKYLEKK